MSGKTYISFTPYYPSSTSLIGPFVHDQVQAIRRAGIFARIVVLKPQPWYVRCLDYKYGEVTVHGVRTFQLPSKVFPNLFDVLNRFFFFRRLRQLGLNDTDVLHLHTSPLAKYGVWMKKAFPSCRIWLQHHDLDPMLVRMGRFRNVRWHQRMVIRRRVADVSCADLQICVSALGLKQLRAFPGNAHTSFPDYDCALAYVVGLSPVTIKNAAVLYNGVDTVLFPPGKKLPHGSFRIGCVAGFYESKGQLTLIRAVEQLVRERDADVSLVLVGIGKERSACEAYVTTHGLEKTISFEEVRGHATLVTFYQSLDLFVLPSVFEAFGCVYLEAAACGVPFICCNGQGCAETISPKDAGMWLVPPNDVCALAMRIEQFMTMRPRQVLSIPIHIDVLVGRFLKEYAVSDERRSDTK